MASTKAGSSSRALSLALERDESRWKPCCKRSSSRDESRDRSPRGALVTIAAKLPDGRQPLPYKIREGLPVNRRESMPVRRSLPTSRHSGTNLSPAGDLAMWHSSRLNNCLTRLTQEKRVSRYHPLTRTDKAGLLGSQQQSGRYLTALLRVSHVFHPSEGLIPSTRPAEFHYR